VSPEDPVAVLERWTANGAVYKVLELTDDHAVVQMCTCHGEPVDLLESEDRKLIEYLRTRD
jgi:hypothetical protein